MNCKIGETKLSIINIYSPTKDDPKTQLELIENISEEIEKVSDGNIIIGGDLNTYLDITKDKKGGIFEKQSDYSKKWNSLCEEYSLLDMWRVRHPTDKIFTWRRKTKAGLVQSRLDYLLVSLGISYQVKKINIKPGSNSDHSLVTMSIEFPELNTRGKGYWKFNNELLHDRKYVKLIKETLDKIKTDDQIENKNILWEYTKCQIRTDTLYYAIQKKKNERKLEEKILYKIKMLEKNLENEVDHIEYLVCKRKWENLQRKKNQWNNTKSKG